MWSDTFCQSLQLPVRPWLYLTPGNASVWKPFTWNATVSYSLSTGKTVHTLKVSHICWRWSWVAVARWHIAVFCCIANCERIHQPIFWCYVDMFHLSIHLLMLVIPTGLPPEQIGWSAIGKTTQDCQTVLTCGHSAVSFADSVCTDNNYTCIFMITC